MHEEIKKAKFTLNYADGIQEDPDTGEVTCLTEVRELNSLQGINRREIRNLAVYFKSQYALANCIPYEDVVCVVELKKLEYVVATDY